MIFELYTSLPGHQWKHCNDDLTQTLFFLVDYINEVLDFCFDIRDQKPETE